MHVERLDAKRSVIRQLLEERPGRLLRPARKFLSSLEADEGLLDRMQLCLPEERPGLRDSVLIVVGDGACWAPLLGNQPGKGRSGAMERARLVLEGLELSPDQILERLRQVPVWFLAIEAPCAPALEAGQAHRLEWTTYRLAALPAATLRRRVLLDQVDAALEAGDQAAFERIRLLLG